MSLGAIKHSNSNNDLSGMFETLEICVARNSELAKQHKENLKLFTSSHDENSRMLQVQIDAPDYQRLYNECVKEWKQVIVKLNSERKNILNQVHSTIMPLNAAHYAIQAQLDDWKKQQKKSALTSENTSPDQLSALDGIQNNLEILAQFIFRTCSITEEMVNSDVSFSDLDYFWEFREVQLELSRLMKKLVEASFIVEQQPSKINTTNRSIEATVRFLLTNINICPIDPTIVVSIISETQATALKLDQISNDKCGDISQNTGQLKLHITNRSLRCEMKQIRIENLERNIPNGGSEADEKFALLFQTEFGISNIADFKCKIWTMSLPIVFISNESQRKHAWGSLAWDYAFSRVCRTPFEVVDKISWDQLAAMLDSVFFNGTGRYLTRQNLSFIRSRINSVAPSSGDKISYQQFYKTALPNCEFSFSDWFFAIIELLQHERIEGPWRNHLIVGFASRHDVGQMLKICKPNTFLLRFSDSVLGALSVAWVESNGEGMKLNMLKPFTEIDFRLNGLGDLMRNLEDCRFLYPEIPKDEAFNQFYTHQIQIKLDGYVQPVLLPTIPK